LKSIEYHTSDVSNSSRFVWPYHDVTSGPTVPVRLLYNCIAGYNRAHRPLAFLLRCFV